MVESKALIDVLSKLDSSFARDLSGLNQSFDGVVVNPRDLSQLDLLPLVLEGTDAALAGRSAFSKEIRPFASSINGSRTNFCNGHESHRDTDAHVKLLIRELRAVIEPSIKGSKSSTIINNLAKRVCSLSQVFLSIGIQKLVFKFKLPWFVVCTLNFLHGSLGLIVKKF